jgi:hypothetical protein
VQLIDRIAGLVLVPVAGENGEVVLEGLQATRRRTQGPVRCMAQSASKRPFPACQIRGDDGVIIDEMLLKPLFIPDLAT